MYQSFFRFERDPFNLTPDPRFLFLSRRHEEALASLIYGVENRKGFIAITGAIGSGKTTLCRAFLGQLDPARYQVALILNPDIDDVELLQSINHEFGLPDDSRSKRALLASLNRFLLEALAAGRICLLMIDEAQNLPPRALEQVRMISNLETETDKLIQIALIGQPQLDTLLHRPELEQLNQRVTVRYHLEPLDPPEVGRYVRHRLEVARPARPVEITADAIALLAEHTGGAPRRINVVCDRALLAAFVEESWTLRRDHIEKAIAEVSGSRPPRREAAEIQTEPAISEAPASAPEPPREERIPLAPPAAPGAAARPATPAPARARPRARRRRNRGLLWAALAISVIVIAFIFTMKWPAKPEARASASTPAGGAVRAGGGGLPDLPSAPPDSAAPSGIIPAASEGGAPAIAALPPATPAPSPTPPPAPSPFPSPTAPPSPTPWPSLTPPPSPTASPSPSVSPSASPSAVPSMSPSVSPSQTPRPSPSVSPTAAVSPSPAPPPAAAAARPSPAPSPSPVPPWTVDESGVVRVSDAEGARVAATLTWLRMRGQSVETESLRRLAPEQIAQMRLQTGKAPLWLRAAELPPDLARLETFRRPALVEFREGLRDLAPWGLIARAEAGQIHLLDPRHGALDLPAEALQPYVKSLTGFYLDAENLAEAIPGESGARIERLWSRLAQSAAPPAPGAAQTPPVYDAPLAAALNELRRHYGLAPEDTLSPLTAWLLAEPETR